VAALVLSEVPDAHVSSAVAANKLALVGVNDHIVDWHTVGVVALYVTAPRVPDLDSAVFGRGDKPFGLAMEGHARDVRRVAVKGEDGVGVGRLDVVQLDRVVSSSGKIALVGRDAEAVNLGIRMRDRARAYAA
jgi:hypothetical protein